MKFKGSAPGRLDVMGGVSDYSGALVLQMPLQEKTEVCLEETGNNLVQINTFQKGKLFGKFEAEWSDLQKLIFLPEQFRKKVKSIDGGNWAIYPLACIAVLIQERKISVSSLIIEFNSNVPLGKGVSSSAAIEVATIRAIGQWKNLRFEGTELAILAQKAENIYVGAPCGLMDQLASCFGETKKLLPILCQPDKISEAITIPDGMEFFGIDSGIKHQVTGASYGDVRTASAMGYSIIANHLGISASELKECKINNAKSKLPFKGYLANICLSEFFTNFYSLIPERISAKDFIENYKETIDPLATIDPNIEYKTRICTWHPVAENNRTNTFKLLLQYANIEKEKSIKNQIYAQMGELMFQSHASYSACGLGHSNTDRLVEMVRERLGQGVYGAKITGGGSGGTVCLLAEGELGLQTVNQIHQKYMEETGKEVLLIKP